jgi:hypothetical protein
MPMRLFVFCLLLLPLRLAMAADAQENDLKAEVSGLRIVAPSAHGNALRAFNWQSGTTLALLITSERGGFVHFDQKNSTISRLTDDKGTDLMTKFEGEPWFGTPGFALLGNISKDGKASAVEINAPNFPAKGAAHLKLDGVVTMLCATATKEYEQKLIALKNGTALKADKLELTIEDVGTPEWGDEPLGLTMRSSTELDEIAEIKFFTADGKEIPSRRTGTSKMGILGAMSVAWDYRLAQKVDVATVKIYVWSDLQKKRVPFSMSVDVGL